MWHTIDEKIGIFWEDSFVKINNKYSYFPYLQIGPISVMKRIALMVRFPYSGYTAKTNNALYSTLFPIDHFQVCVYHPVQFLKDWTAIFVV